ncbi:MAG: mannitol dehydrogenase family protein, partial [Mesorhizobium sp.]
FETVDRAFADPAIRQFVDGLWAEAITTLPKDAGLDTADYTAQLAKRYSNTALAHRTAQIANDGSQKLPQRIIASAMERM